MWWLFVVAFVAMLVVQLLRVRSTQPAPTPALKLAGGPPDDADDARAGRPLFDAIADALRAGGVEVASVEPDDWGYSAAATVSGQTVLLKLGAHGSNGVGRIWLLTLEGAGTDAAQAVERLVAAMGGVKVLGWDD
ncbi:MAG TPA: hypothetical protein VN947_00030 [Polyangia bacterium]|nr:hypothetical protein [Polyangia bacterium]